MDARVPVVSESGIATRTDIDQLAAQGVTAVLVGETLIEIGTDDLIDATLLDQFHFLAEARQQGQRFFRCDDFQWMRFKGKNDPCSVVLTGDLRHPAKNDLVPQMHAVEVANRHHRVRAGVRDMFGAANDLHRLM